VYKVDIQGIDELSRIKNDCHIIFIISIIIVNN